MSCNLAYIANVTVVYMCALIMRQPDAYADDGFLLRTQHMIFGDLIFLYIFCSISSTLHWVLIVKYGTGDRLKDSRLNARNMYFSSVLMSRFNLSVPCYHGTYYQDQFMDKRHSL